MGQLEQIRLESSKWIVLVIGSGAIGLLAGVNPKYGIAGALGLAFTVAAMANLTAGLVLFSFLSFLEVLNNGGGGGGASFIKVAGFLLFGSWYATTLTRSQHRLFERRIHPGLVACLIGLIAWSALSISWAESPSGAAGDTARYLLNALLFPIVLTAVRRREHLLWVLAAFVAGAVVSTLYGFANPVSATNGDFGRLTGSLGDANEQAAVLVAAIPAAMALAAVMRGRPALRLIAVAGGIICLAGVVNTLSRGGLVALAVMMVAAVIFGGRWRPKAIVLVLVTVLGTAGYFVAIAPSSARQRVSSSDTSGRNDIWTVAWRMVQAKPFTGVGSGNFQTAAIHYLQKPGAITNANLIVDVPHVAHNIYLELLADLGVPGLVLLLGVVLGCVGAAGKAARVFQRTGQRDLEVVARCLVLALVGFMAADFFLSGEFSKQLWLLLALAPATLAVARSPIAA